MISLFPREVGELTVDAITRNRDGVVAELIPSAAAFHCVLFAHIYLLLRRLERGARFF